jgi:hypothetical protein
MGKDIHKKVKEIVEDIYDERTRKEARKILEQLKQLSEREERRSRCCKCGIGQGEDNASIVQHPETKDLYCEECWSEMCLEFYYDNVGERDTAEEDMN